MEPRNIQGNRYPGYGCCIYCGSKGEEDGLRDEHIIPFSLGGNTYIVEASCAKCERILNPVDTHLARSVYGELRIHNRVQTRNPRSRPSKLPATLIVDEEKVSSKFTVDDHPFALVLPLWGKAGFFRLANIDEPFPGVY